MTDKLILICWVKKKSLKMPFERLSAFTVSPYPKFQQFCNFYPDMGSDLGNFYPNAGYGMIYFSPASTF